MYNQKIEYVSNKLKPVTKYTHQLIYISLLNKLIDIHGRYV